MPTHKEFAEKLKQFCLDHGFEIAGTCTRESIYGEITIVKIGDDPVWRRWEENRFTLRQNSVESVLDRVCIRICHAYNSRYDSYLHRRDVRPTHLRSSLGDARQ